MKKHLVLTVGLAVLSTSAFATKARMEALGENANRGSFFIQDNRNIFRNAAQVNSMKNYVVTEWGTAAVATADSAAAPKAEGGFFREAGAFSYGLYLGSNINDNTLQRNNTTPPGYIFTPTSSTVTTAATTGKTLFLDPGNKLDFFLAGDAGAVEWGARLGYAYNNDKDGITGTNGTKFERTAKQFQLGLGAVFGDLQAYANLDLVNEAKGATMSADKWESDTGVNLGVNYHFMGWTAWGDYQKQGAEYTDGAATSNKSTWKDYEWNVGVGKTHEVSSGARIYTSLKYLSTRNQYKGNLTNVLFQGRTLFHNMPITFGYEADATSWLTLRGSISQNVNFLSAKNGNLNGDLASTAGIAESANTDVSAGATFNFGKLKVDGSIGGQTLAGAAGETGILRLDSVMSRVAVHYWF